MIKGGNNNLCNITLSAIAGTGTGLPAGATAVFGHESFGNDHGKREYNAGRYDDRFNSNRDIHVPDIGYEFWSWLSGPWSYCEQFAYAYC